MASRGKEKTVVLLLPKYSGGWGITVINKFLYTQNTHTHMHIHKINKWNKREVLQICHQYKSAHSLLGV